MITIETTTVNGRQEILSGTPRELDCGLALIEFMQELRGRVVLAVLSMDGLRTREMLDEHIYHFVSYHGTEEMLRAFREALWYYTRHPHRRAILEAVDARRLDDYCEQYRWNYREDAQFFPREGSENPNIHWRHALLFAARIKDREEIARALRLSDPNFEDVIRIWVNDRRHEEPFSYWLMLAEATAPAP